MHVAELFRQDDMRSVAVAPEVVVFSQWAEDLLVRMCMLDGKAAPGSIDPIALQLLWAEALGTGMSFLADGERVLAARQARTAERLIRNWWPQDDQPRLERAFWSARKAVSGQLRQKQLLSPEMWLEALANRLLAHAGQPGASVQPIPVALPEKLLLDGFLELTSLEQQVFSALEQRGVVVEQVNVPPPATCRMGVASFRSLEEELAAAAHWAKTQVQNGGRYIAVVINALEAHTRLARTIFENILCTARRLALQDMAESEFHLAHGDPLAAHPVISDALLLLQLSLTGLSREQEFFLLSRCLLSPYWRGADSERVARARLELRLRKEGRYWRSLAEVLRLVRTGSEGKGLDAMLGCAEQLEQLVRGARKNDAFCAHFYAILDAWGWPGPLARGADVARHVSQFGLLLEQLGGFDLDSAGHALNTLTRMCAENQLELRGGPLSPIQILSPEDAAGRRFDAAWIANVHDGNWPSHPLTNPFLPASAAERIPRSSAAGELQYCERITRELKSLAPDVCFSWSRQTGDVPNGISPLLADLPGAEQLEEGQGQASTSSMHSLVATEARQLNGYHNHPWLTAVADGQGLPLRGSRGLPLWEAQAESPAENIPGGSGMISDQAACPMMAYFRHRLKAGFESMPQPFADAAYRGSLMHAAMQFLFAGQEGQPGAPPTGRVVPAVAAAMNKHNARQRLLPVSFAAERLRLENLLVQWLEFETARQGFTVECLEKPITAELHGHPISVRADRIDRLDDASLMIIDYKSSKGSTSGWSQDRLQQAQLPLYAVLLSRQGRHAVGDVEGGTVGGAASGPVSGSASGPVSGPVGGIGLATVRQGECGFSGISQNVAGTFDGIKSFDNQKTGFAKRFSGWDRLLQHWEEGIDALAVEIKLGVSANVLFDKNSLQWAGMDILLRREEGAAWLLEHGGGGDEDDEEDENFNEGSGDD
ncbi:MAG: hypothetical protein EXR85_04405 [Xanthomonadales bacterium]|nr:hypothetical protein [Xanthomonadales bacterium]